MNVLVSVQYPLTKTDKRAIQRGWDLVEGREDTELVIFHLDQVLNDRRISRQELRTAVESVGSDIEANYVVREGIVAEEAIIEIAVEYEMDRIILSPQRRKRWQRLLRGLPGIEQDLEQVIVKGIGIEVEIIQELNG